MQCASLVWGCPGCSLSGQSSSAAQLFEADGIAELTFLLRIAARSALDDLPWAIPPVCHPGKPGLGKTGECESWLARLKHFFSNNSRLPRMTRRHQATLGGATRSRSQILSPKHLRRCAAPRRRAAPGAGVPHRPAFPAHPSQPIPLLLLLHCDEGWLQRVKHKARQNVLYRAQLC